uniref:Uncharacterized protein n=1 Tax=Anguilla anguilla TaxID=7936 RepID=A0A0E9WL75_ANGAN
METCKECESRQVLLQYGFIRRCTEDFRVKAKTVLCVCYSVCVCVCVCTCACLYPCVCVHVCVWFLAWRDSGSW